MAQLSLYQPMTGSPSPVHPQVMVQRRLLCMLTAVREMDKESIIRKLSDKKASLDKGNSRLGRAAGLGPALTLTQGSFIRKLAGEK